MNLIKCDAGHYYDGDKYASCPHCAKTNQEPAPTIPAENKGEASMIMCQNGHYYDEKKYTSCPYCKQENRDLDTTVPLNQESVSLAGIVKAARKTVFADEDATISLSMTQKGTEPVVGWLVCIQGEEFGKSYSLKSNKNFIGRSDSSDIIIKGDNSVSREKHAVIIYEPHEKIFIAQPGESRELYYLNNKVVLNNETVQAYDILSIGKTKLLFIPLCGERFCWEELGKEENK